MKNVRKYNKTRNAIVAVNLAQFWGFWIAVYFLFTGEFYAAVGFFIVTLLFGLALPVTHKDE